MTSLEETTHLVRDQSAQSAGQGRHDGDAPHLYSPYQPMPGNGTRNVPIGNPNLSRNGYTGLNGFEMHDLSPGTEVGRLPGHGKTDVTTSTNEQRPPTAKAKSPHKARSAWCKPFSFGRRDKQKIRTFSWKWEFIALGVSAASMVAMISLLAWADNRPLLEWKLLLSFNAVISILGTLCKAPFAFVIGSCLSQAKWNWFKRKPDTLETYGKIDSASHGALGSFSLAYHIHFKHWIVVGALVTVALIAFEPFLQAIVFYSGQTESPGTILSTIHLDAGTYVPKHDPNESPYNFNLPNGQSMTYEGKYLSRPDTGLVSALLNGLDTHYSAFQLTPSWTCPSGNCSWATFTSAAICSACYNLSDHLQRNSLSSNSSRGTISLPNTDKIPQDTTLTNFSLPLVNVVNFDWTGNMNGDFALMVAASTTNPGHTVSFQHNDTLLAAYQVIAPARSFGNGQTKWNETEMFATECGLYMCTQAYKSAVVNGTFTEQVLGSWSARMTGSYAILPGNMVTQDPDTLAEYDSSINYSLISADPGYDVPRTDLVLEISEQELSDAIVAANATRSFNITQNMTGSTSYLLGPQVMNNGSLIWPLTGISENAIPGIVTQALYESDNLAATFEQLAQSMTNWARHYSGVQYFSPRKDLLIQIRWAYLALPAICLIAGWIFIVLLIIETKRFGLKPWKDDFIFGLAHSLDSKSADILRERKKTDGDTKELAKNMTVRFENTDGTWQLKETTKNK